MNEDHKNPIKWGWNTLVDDIKTLHIPDFQFKLEKELEEEFIHRLVNKNGYERLSINKGYELQDNLRIQLQRLNHVQFNDREWEEFLKKHILNNQDNVSGIDRIERFQTQKVFDFTFEDGTTKNIQIVDIYEPNNNILQVCNQLQTKNDDSGIKHIYDVIILLNGLPVVHVELKNSGISIQEAFNQINNGYKRDYYRNADAQLMQYIQLFVISNGDTTKYFANNRFQKGDMYQNFEFTYFWSDFKNNKIEKLSEFTETFFNKQTIISLLTRYCTFKINKNTKTTLDKKSLLVMRPYQIAATEKIVQKVIETTDKYLEDPLKRSGYIWHTTGSGKTLTSFKTSVILADNNLVDKVIFIVDRKDLDQQIAKSYNEFAPGTTNTINSTTALKNNLENPNRKIIVTTIQKMSRFIKKEPDHEVFKKHVALIFDECHRSQFGEMHKSIKQHFTNYHLFGFTGTPIFANDAKNVQIRNNEYNFATSTKMATGDIFGDILHTYTIIEAIKDNNVLPFKTYFHNDFGVLANNDDLGNAVGIDKEKVLQDPVRIKTIAENILDNYWTLTGRKYELKSSIGLKCNGILATDSIEIAKQYYRTFKELLKDRDESKQLKIGIIFSEGKYDDNRSEPEELEDRESIEENELVFTDVNKTFLQTAVDDFNKHFNTNFNIENQQEFQAYYSSVAEHMKDASLDLLIVVNMFLTGFDAPCINTLFVDKTLVKHNLIQAFSRTNRLYDPTIKPYGNVVCYAHNLKQEFDKALTIYSVNNESLAEIKDKVQVKAFSEYKAEYDELLKQLKAEYPASNISGWDTEDKNIKFTKLFNQFLVCKNMLSQSIEWNETEDLLNEDEFLKWIGHYEDFRKVWNSQLQKSNDPSDQKAYINEQLDFKLQLVSKNYVSVDYIMNLLASFSEKNNPTNKNEELINKYLNLCPDLNNHKDLRELIFKFYFDYQNANFNEDYLSLLDDKFSKKKYDDFDQIVKSYGLDWTRLARKLNDVIEGGSTININDVDKFYKNTDKRMMIFNFKENKAKNLQVYNALCEYCNKYKSEWIQMHTQKLPLTPVIENQSVEANA